MRKNITHYCLHMLLIPRYKAITLKRNICRLLANGHRLVTIEILGTLFCNVLFRPCSCGTIFLNQQLYKCEHSMKKIINVICIYHWRLCRF